MDIGHHPAPPSPQDCLFVSHTPSPGVCMQYSVPTTSARGEVGRGKGEQRGQPPSTSDPGLGRMWNLGSGIWDLESGTAEVVSSGTDRDSDSDTMPPAKKPKPSLPQKGTLGGMSAVFASRWCPLARSNSVVSMVPFSS